MITDHHSKEYEDAIPEGFESREVTAAEVAQLIAEQNIVCLYQGRSEAGPRALGNRSILANPTIEGMKDRINKVIKKREG